MSDKLIVIGITGVAESGKDTVAKILCRDGEPFGYFRIALADGVRAALRDLDGATWSFSKELGKEANGIRKGMQKIGGDSREAVAEKAWKAAKATSGYASLVEHADVVEEHANRFWCYYALTKLYYAARIHPFQVRRFVIPDVSYAREIDTLEAIVRQLGGHYETWRIERPGSGLSGDAAHHASEVGRATIPADYTIRNDDSIARLAAEVRCAAERVGRHC